MAPMQGHTFDFCWFVLWRKGKDGGSTTQSSVKEKAPLSCLKVMYHQHKSRQGGEEHISPIVHQGHAEMQNNRFGSVSYGFAVATP